MSESETPVETKTKKRHKIGANLGKKKGHLLEIPEKTYDIINDSLRGLTQRDVAERNGVSIDTIDRILDRWRPIFARLEETPDYRKAKTRLLEAAELRMLESVLDESVIAKATLNNRSYSLEIISKLLARERGISEGSGPGKTFVTFNISLASEYKDSQKPETPEPLASSPAIPTTSELMAITAPDSEPDKEP